jgi:hypothetical protein
VLQPVLVRRRSVTTPAEEADTAAEADQPLSDSTGSAATVSATPHPTYQVVAGERRVRAARLAGIREIPAIICSY